MGNIESSRDRRLTVVNMSPEMFNDALFYREKSLEANISKFDKWRYLRTSLICFCCSVEAWVNKVIAHQFRKESVCLTERQKLILIKLEDPHNRDGEIVNTPEKLFAILPEALGVSASRTLIFKYLKLSTVRNGIIHFAPGNFDEVYNEANLIKLVNEAPQIVEDLMYSYYPDPDAKDKPLWFSQRISRQII